MMRASSPFRRVARSIVPFILMTGGLFLPAQAFAESDLSRYFDQKITAVENSLCSLPEAVGSTQSGFPSMAIQDLNLDFIPTVTIGISDVLSLSISPEIDFIMVLNQPGS
jgi:hypothetical protein